MSHGQSAYSDKVAIVQNLLADIWQDLERRCEGAELGRAHCFPPSTARLADCTGVSFVFLPNANN